MWIIIERNSTNTSNLSNLDSNHLAALHYDCQLHHYYVGIWKCLFWFFFHMFWFTWFAAIQLCQSITDIQKCHEFSIENRKKRSDLIKTSIFMVVMGGSRAILMFVTAFCFVNWLQFWISLRPVAASSWYFKTICKLRTQCSLTFKNKHIWRDSIEPQVFCVPLQINSFSKWFKIEMMPRQM